MVTAHPAAARRAAKRLASAPVPTISTEEFAGMVFLGAGEQ